MKKKSKYLPFAQYLKTLPIKERLAVRMERDRLEIHHWKQEAKELNKAAEFMVIELKKKMKSCAEFCRPPYMPVGGHICNDAHCHKSIMAHFKAKARQYLNGLDDVKGEKK
jgi:hypothetical protein